MFMGSKRGIATGVGLAALVAFTTLSGTVRAAPVAKAAQKHTSTTNRCKTRNKATGTVKFSSWQFPDTLNPNQTALGVSFTILYGVLDQLWAFDNKGHVIPQLAADVPTVKNGGIKNGGKTIVVHLRQGVKWSNGVEVTAADVAFGWKIGMDPDSGPWCGGSCDEIARIDTPNKYTSVWHMKEVYAAAIPNAAPAVWPRVWGTAWNNDAHVATDKLFGDTSFNFEDTSYPTNGPYQVAQVVQDDRVVLHPMKYYSTLACGASVKNMIFAFYSSKEGMIAAAASHDTDVTTNYTLADLKELKSHRKIFQVHIDPQYNIEQIQFNSDKTYNGQPNPLGSAKVRQALALSLDKAGLIRSGLGVTAKQEQQIVAWSPLVVTKTFVQPFADKQLVGQWDPIQRSYQSNTGHGKVLADARKLLAQTPFKHGFTLDFYTTQGNPVRDAEAAVIQSSWAKLGVQLNINRAPSSRLFADWDHGGIFTQGKFQVGLWTASGAADPDSTKYNFQSQYIDRNAKIHAAINGNFAGIHDKVIDRAFNVGAHSFKRSVRAVAYKSFQRELNQQAYWVMLYYRPAITTADRHITPFSNNPVTDMTWNMYAWKTVRGS